jgi:hypothetical protein
MASAAYTEQEGQKRQGEAWPARRPWYTEIAERAARRGESRSVTGSPLRLPSS